MAKKKIETKEALDGSTGTKTDKVIFSVNISRAHKEAFKRMCHKANRSQSTMFEILIDGNA